MHLNRKIGVFLSIMAVVSMAFVLAACAPAPAHCLTSAHGGDNTRVTSNPTETPEYYGGPSLNHETDDGHSSTQSFTLVQANPFTGGTSSSPKYAAHFYSNVTQGCIAHWRIEPISSGSQTAPSYNRALNVSTSSLVVRESDIVMGYANGGDVIGDAIHITHESAFSKGTDLGLYRDDIQGDTCIVNEVTSTWTLDSSALNCPGQAFKGAIGNGDNEGLVVDKTIIEAHYGLFDVNHLTDTAGAFNHSTVVVSRIGDETAARFIVSLGAFDPLTSFTSSTCQANTIWWPYDSAMPQRLIDKWSAVCASTTFTTGTNAQVGNSVRAAWVSAAGADSSGNVEGAVSYPNSIT
jgi:hypothetical protein